MKISVREQRELADYIASQVVMLPINASEKHIANVVWDAIEDYTAIPESQDILEAHKAATEAA